MRIKSFILFFIFIFIVSGAFAMLKSGAFEKNPPVIHLPSEVYTNLKDPVKLEITDESGIKQVKISLYLTGMELKPLLAQNFTDKKKKISLNLNFPKNSLLNSGHEYKLKIEVTDCSKSNFFTGNKTSKIVNLIIDKKLPEVYVLAQSYKISRGGSAAVVFKASDENNLKDLKIVTNFGKVFKVTPFKKDGFYTALVAWPTKEKDFRAHIVASDEAGNVNKTRIRYYLQDRKYKISTIPLSDNFLDGKISELVEHYAKDPSKFTKLDKFKFINETLRNKNEKIIVKISENVPEKMIDNFYLKPFYPLKNAAAVASFGDHRFYTYEGFEISQSYHLGLDLASYAMADIKASNPGVVAFNEKNGIFGNNLIIYHGLGLYTLYGHCTDSKLPVGADVRTGEVVATTGKTGLALGDHLHFGILIQGIEVRPEEWMDKNWMKINVYDILKSAEKIINKN